MSFQLLSCPSGVNIHLKVLGWWVSGPLHPALMKITSRHLSKKSMNSFDILSFPSISGLPFSAMSQMALMGSVPMYGGTPSFISKAMMPKDQMSTCVFIHFLCICICIYDLLQSHGAQRPNIHLGVVCLLVHNLVSRKENDILEWIYQNMMVKPQVPSSRVCRPWCTSSLPLRSSRRNQSLWSWLDLASPITRCQTAIETNKWKGDKGFINFEIVQYWNIARIANAVQVTLWLSVNYLKRCHCSQCLLVSTRVC